MCGICGYIHFDRTKAVREEVVEAMADTLVHRGPDDSGTFVKGNVGLGHRRLSIIDLTTGHQPMFNEDGSVAIVYNGEIYNFRELKDRLEERGHTFSTHSDTEVIVHAYEEYGEECLEKFNGMFAFCIWDGRRDRLFLARDRFGKKPLYYGTFNNQFMFASEVKALLKHPDVIREIDMVSVSKYLAYDYVPVPRSIFKNIFKVKPGHWLTVESGRIRTGAYWDLTFTHVREFDPRAAGETLVRLLKKAVEARLVSDVPLGVFLSGGIDSSCVVAMMAELMDPKDIKTFSIGFREGGYDESSSARLVASRFNTDHHEQIVRPGAMLEVLPRVVDALDEPHADSSIIPTYIVSNFTRRYVTVALGGDGGDELFAGYNSFLAHLLSLYYEALPRALRSFCRAFSSRILPVPAEPTNFLFRMRRFLKDADMPKAVRHQLWLSSFPPELQARVFADPGKVKREAFELYSEAREYFATVEGEDPLDRVTYLLVKTYMTDDILTKVDRASMANSLEVRAPFLDRDFAEFAASIPSRFKVRHFTKKWILKEAFKDRLPREILHKPKHGFAVPIGMWLKDDLKGMVLDAFRKDKIEREGIFDSRVISEMVARFLSNKGYTEREIWPLFMFELWYNKWMK